MDKETILLYMSIKSSIDMLTDEQAGQIFKAILDYQESGEYSLEGIMNAVFAPIKEQIDYNNKKWKLEKEKRSRAGKKGMAKRWGKEKDDISDDNNVITDDKSVITNDNTLITDDNTVITSYNNDNTTITDDNTTITNITDNVNVNVNVNDNVNVNVNDNDNVNDKKHIKEKKHKYGEYKHVMLTDRDIELLRNDYDDNVVSKAIKILDEYIEMKGAKYKNHYLVMKKWVLEKAIKEVGYKSNTYSSIQDEWRNA